MEEKEEKYDGLGSCAGGENVEERDKARVAARRLEGP